MKEFVSKQLEEQIGKLIDDLVKEDFNQIGIRCEAVNMFVLKGDSVFEAGVKSDKEKLDINVGKSRKKCVDLVEKAFELKEVDDQYNMILNAVTTFTNEEQQHTIDYLLECINTISNYKRDIIDKEDKLEGKQSVKSTDDVVNFLKEND